MIPPFDEVAGRRLDPMSSSRFPSDAAAFEMPSLQRATHLFRALQARWGGWIETGLDGTFVIVHTPERISELDELLGTVENWITQQTFFAVRFHLEGRVYIMQRDGFIGPADRDHAPG